MAGAGSPAARSPGSSLPPPLSMSRPHVVEEGAPRLSRAAHADVVAGVGAATATTVRGQQVIPALAIDQDRGFAVDGDVARQLLG